MQPTFPTPLPSDRPIKPSPSPVQPLFSVRYKTGNPAYERHAKSIRRRNAVTVAGYLLLFWVFLVLLLRPESAGEALLVGLERSGPLAGGVLICLLWLNLRSEKIPVAWKNEEQLLSFDHIGLTFRSELQQTHIRWRAFQSWEEDRHGFTLHGYSPVFIPAFPFEPEALTAFRDCLRAHLWAENQ